MGWRGALWRLAAAALLFSREPGHLLHPQLWGEDGLVWVSQAYTIGPASLFGPVAGYLQTLSRLAALLAVNLPLTWAPGIFASIAFIVQLAPAALMLSWRGAILVPYAPARLLLVAFYIGEPNAAEVYVNLTNAMWHLALLAFLLVLAPKPKTVAGMAADGAALALAGLSGPLALFIAPMAFWQAFARRRGPDGRSCLAYAGLLAAGALLQLGCILSAAGSARHGVLGANVTRLAHIIADQILLGGIIGGNLVLALMAKSFWSPAWPAALICAAGLVLGVLAFIKGPAAHRLLVLFAGLIFAAGIASPMVSFTMPQWQPMQYPGIGTRYYVMAILAWFSTLLVLAGGGMLRWPARFLLACCLIGIAGDWQIPPYVQTGYHDAAKAFAKAPAGTEMTFPENPVPWHFTLVKR